MRDSRARRPAVRKIRSALSKLAASDTVAVGAAAAVAHRMAAAACVALGAEEALAPVAVAELVPWLAARVLRRRRHLSERPATPPGYQRIGTFAKRGHPLCADRILFRARPPAPRPTPKCQPEWPATSPFSFIADRLRPCRPPGRPLVSTGGARTRGVPAPTSADEPYPGLWPGAAPFRRRRGTAGGVVAENRIKPTFSTPDVGGCCRPHR